MADKEDRDFLLYNKIKIGAKQLEDAALNLESLPYGTLKYGNRTLGSKKTVMQALADNDLDTLRAISNYFYRTSGIYQRACNYFATLYRYD